MAYRGATPTDTVSVPSGTKKHYSVRDLRDSSRQLEPIEAESWFEARSLASARDDLDIAKLEVKLIP